MHINISIILIDFSIVKEWNPAARCQIPEKNLSHDRGRS